MVSNISKSNKIKGVSSAVAVAFLQGFEGLLFPLLGLFFAFAIYESIGFSVSALLIKEIFTVFLFLIIRGPKKIALTFKKLKSDKEARLLILAGVIGTTLGNLFYFIAIQLGGSSYGVILTSLYPIFSMILIRIIIKDKEGWKVWLGATIALIGSMLFILLPTITSGQPISNKQVIGIAIGALASFFWAFEGIFINLYFKRTVNNKNPMDTMDTVVLRSTGATISTSLIIIPLTYFLSLGIPSIHNPFKIIGDILSTWETSLIMLSISFNLIFLRIIHIKAIYLIGAKLTAIIDTNNFLVPALFAIFLRYTYLNFVNGDPMFEPIVWWAWLLIIPILVGVYIVLYFHKPNE